MDIIFIVQSFSVAHCLQNRQTMQMTLVKLFAPEDFDKFNYLQIIFVY